MSRTQTPFERLCKRFEIAVGNFGRSCIDMRANEKAFQAWYAACVIQEFGLSRVYREVHLAKPDLFEFAPACSFTAPHKTGNELFPDLSVSWEQDVDARSSNTRRSDLKHAGAMLTQFGILSELKVTGSTGVATLPQQIERDLSKLAVFAAAHKAAEPAPEAPRKRELATYLVVLDNFCNNDGGAEPKYETSMSNLLEQVALKWPTNISPPIVLLLVPSNGSSNMLVSRQFEAPRIEAIQKTKV